MPDTLTWENIRSRAQHGLHVWLPDHIRPGDTPDGMVLFEWREPDDEGAVALGGDRYEYMQTVFELAKDGYRRWPECEEHKLFLNMGPMGKHSGTYFCCYCGLDFDMVAKRVPMPTEDDPDRTELIVTIVRPA